uniref:Uncharacterized protein n=1 Tax=Arundo donax TaxID=35708 RepID=A0A0A9D5Z0_ARUDO
MIAKDNPIIYSNETNLRHPEPARLTTPCLGVVHNIIKHKKISLKPFDTPTKGAGKKCLLLAQNIYTLQYLVAIDDREPTVALSSEHIVIHHLLQTKQTSQKSYLS